MRPQQAAKVFEAFSPSASPLLEICTTKCLCLLRNAAQLAALAAELHGVSIEGVPIFRRRLRLKKIPSLVVGLEALWNCPLLAWEITPSDHEV